MGYLSLVLHAHMPFVRHPEQAEMLEERWFFEAVIECYLPLLSVLDQLADVGFDYRLTFSISPTLLAMLNDDLLMGRCRRHLERLRKLAESECRRTEHDMSFHAVARMYRRRLGEANKLLNETYRGGLPGILGKLRDSNHIELITTAATHGYLPLLRHMPGAVETQVDIGLRAFREVFGRSPAGFWLPECGYAPGIEKILKRHRIRYSFLDEHGLMLGRPPSARGIHAPIHCGNGVAFFGRDPDATEQVWSAEQGYPGDPLYREFYRDIGYDLDADYIRAYLPDGIPGFTGLKYYRVTGKTGDKSPYDATQAVLRAQEHARHFVGAQVRRCRASSAAGGAPPLITTPFDAELFGHWWYEGPTFLAAVIREAMACPELELMTPLDYLKRHGKGPAMTPTESSWGWRGYHSAWLNEDTAWMYPLLEATQTRLRKLMHNPAFSPPAAKRALIQAQRSLLIAQASDWAFMLHADPKSGYPRRRFRDELGRCNWLCQAVEMGKNEERTLQALETMDNIFPFMNRMR